MRESGTCWGSCVEARAARRCTAALLVILASRPEQGHVVVQGARHAAGSRAEGSVTRRLASKAHTAVLCTLHHCWLSNAEHARELNHIGLHVCCMIADDCSRAACMVDVDAEKKGKACCSS